MPKSEYLFDDEEESHEPHAATHKSMGIATDEIGFGEHLEGGLAKGVHHAKDFRHTYRVVAH